MEPFQLPVKCTQSIYSRSSANYESAVVALWTFFSYSWIIYFVKLEGHIGQFVFFSENIAVFVVLEVKNDREKHNSWTVPVQIGLNNTNRPNFIIHIQIPKYNILDPKPAERGVDEMENDEGWDNNLTLIVRF